MHASHLAEVRAALSTLVTPIECASPATAMSNTLLRGTLPILRASRNDTLAATLSSAVYRVLGLTTTAAYAASAASAAGSDSVWVGGLNSTASPSRAVDIARH
jgi:hypothetical protein